MYTSATNKRGLPIEIQRDQVPTGTHPESPAVSEEQRTLTESALEYPTTLATCKLRLRREEDGSEPSWHSRRSRISPVDVTREREDGIYKHERKN